MRERAAPRDPGGLRRARLPARSPTPRSRPRRSAHSSRRPARPRPRGGRRGRRPRARRAHHRRRRGAGAGSPRASARSRDAVFDMQRQRVVGRLPADLGDDRRRRRGATPPSTIRTTTRARAPATGSRASAGSTCRRCPHGVDPRSIGVDDAAAGTRPGCRRRAGEAGASASAPTRSWSRSGPAFGDRLRETIGGPRITATCSRALLRRACGRAGAEPRLVRVRRTSDVAFIGHDGARLSGSRRRDRAAVEGHGADPPRRPASRSTTSSCSAWRPR